MLFLEGEGMLGLGVGLRFIREGNVVGGYVL